MYFLFICFEFLFCIVDVKKKEKEKKRKEKKRKNIVKKCVRVCIFYVSY
jgi:hypothetical protein